MRIKAAHTLHAVTGNLLFADGVMRLTRQRPNAKRKPA